MFELEMIDGVYAVIRLKESMRITGENSMNFREWLLKQNFENSKAVLFDADNLVFVDSMGIASFIALYKKLNQKQIPIIMCGLSPDIKNLFIMLKLDTLFEIECSSVFEVIEKLRS
ncbi:STAS domain-containing protein [Kosmotoga pacifica]|uniref:STAS domain-containing protein n=1 Tax=Kosmotoga pacifica TaxID=1330330 RepID=A0A0G2Z792_9BACT|nr:STAS domain-containing protein [Kosmotoga pacifica]AKI97450.1 hypothetical protein IX53_06035 [Kosmotoga pacifica]